MTEVLATEAPRGLAAHDLVRDYGEDYQLYRRDVPMLAPVPKRTASASRAKMRS